MQRYRIDRRMSLSLMTLCCTVIGSVVTLRAQDAQNISKAEAVFRVKESASELKITEKFAKIIELKTRIARVDGFDPDVVNVTALSPHRIRVQAITPGVTTLVLVDEHDEMFSIELFVTGDVRHLQAYIAQLFPNASVEAVEVRESVVLRGWVTQPEHIPELVEIAEQFYPRVLNQMKVGGVQQVLMKVKVMEVQRSKVRQLGFNLLYGNRHGYFGSTPGQLTPIAGISMGGAANGSTPGTTPPVVNFRPSSLADPTLSFGIIDQNALFQGFLEALKEEGLLKIRAEPTLVTTNGRPATLLNGGEFPILVPQSLGTVTIEWREFGVRMEAVPIILGNGRLRLEVQPEVSERDFANALQHEGLTVPALTVRRANTQVEMKFGETLMIAGLISTRETASTSKVPFLGEIPWIGAAFSRKHYDEVETELVILVTPEYVGPLDPSQVPPGGPGQFSSKPVDRELFIDGMLEVPNYGDECIGCPPPQGLLPGPMSPIPDAGPMGMEPLPAPPGHGPGMLPPPMRHGRPDLTVPPLPDDSSELFDTRNSNDSGPRASRTGMVPASGSRSQEPDPLSHTGFRQGAPAGPTASPFHSPASRSGDANPNVQSNEQNSRNGEGLRRRPKPGLIQPNTSRPSAMSQDSLSPFEPSLENR